MPRAKVSIRALREELAAMTRERDAYKRAKGENDDRFMIERDTAREELRKALLERDEAKERETDARRDFAALESDAALVVRAYEDQRPEALGRAIRALRLGGRDGWVERALSGTPSGAR